MIDEDVRLDGTYATKICNGYLPAFCKESPCGGLPERVDVVIELRGGV